MLKPIAVSIMPVFMLAAVSMLPPGGCTVDLLEMMVGLDQADSSVNPTSTEDVVNIRFRNLLTAEAVDVQFYMADSPLANLPADLFTPEHLVVASIGVAGTGILQPQKEDVIQVPCAENLTLGTLGGRFTDNETGEARGTGTSRWVQQGPVELCGSIVTLEFSAGESEGQFSTWLTIGK